MPYISTPPLCTHVARNHALHGMNEDISDSLRRFCLECSHVLYRRGASSAPFPRALGRCVRLRAERRCCVPEDFALPQNEAVTSLGPETKCVCIGLTVYDLGAVEAGTAGGLRDGLESERGRVNRR